jgi:hypothetical protein
MIILINNIHSLIKPIVRRVFNKHISFLKLTSFLSNSIGKIEMILDLIENNIFEKSLLIKSIKQKCTYDERSNRTNFEESLIEIFK